MHLANSTHSKTTPQSDQTNSKTSSSSPTKKSNRQFKQPNSLSWITSNAESGMDEVKGLIEDFTRQNQAKGAALERLNEATHSFRSNVLNPNPSITNELVLFPTSASIREEMKMENKQLYRIGTILITTLSAIGSIVAANGVGNLITEAGQLRLYGVTSTSSVITAQYGVKGWRLIATGYGLCSARRLFSLVLALAGYFLPDWKVDVWYPEYSHQHIVRNVGYLISQLLIMSSALIVITDFDYKVTPLDGNNCAPYETTYLYRLTKNGPAASLLLIAAIVQIVWLGLMALPWCDGLNVFYLLPICRCRQEWDDLPTNDSQDKQIRQDGLNTFQTTLQNNKARYDTVNSNFKAGVNRLPSFARLSFTRTKPAKTRRYGSLLRGSNRFQLPAIGDSGNDVDGNKAGDDSDDGNDSQSDTSDIETTQTTPLSDQWKPLPKNQLDQEWYNTPSWLRLLQMYDDPCGCFILGQGSQRGTEVRNCGFATFAHNWYGSFRMHIYVYSILFLIASMFQYESVYKFHQSPRTVTWPIYVYLPDSNVTNTTVYFPSVSVSSCVASYSDTTGTTSLTTKSPPSLDDTNDSTSYMASAAGWWMAAEVFHIISSIAYWIGIVRNESSVPASHTPIRRSRSIIRLLCP
jgi:hypothetical protein